MLIKSRPADLTNVARNKEKTRLVLEWLLEHRFSSIEFLAATLGLEPNGVSRFINQLKEDGLIESLNPKKYKKRGLVILGPRAARFLEGETRDFTADITKGRRMEYNAELHHALQIQKALLKYLPTALEIISEYNIKKMIKRPDALVFQENSLIAIEFEDSGKFRKTTQLIFQVYIDMIKSGQVSEVHFHFSNVKTCENYKKWFNEIDWFEGEIRTKKKTSKLTGSTLYTPADHWIRDRFKFIETLSDDLPEIFSFEDATKPKPTFVLSYKEREEEERYKILAESAQRRRDLYASLSEQKSLENVAEQDKEHRRMERLRFERSERIKSLMGQLEESKIRDSKPSAWLPGYVSKTDEIQNELNKYLSDLIVQ